SGRSVLIYASYYVELGAVGLVDDRGFVGHCDSAGGGHRETAPGVCQRLDRPLDGTAHYASFHLQLRNDFAAWADGRVDAALGDAGLSRVFHLRIVGSRHYTSVAPYAVRAAHHFGRLAYGARTHRRGGHELGRHVHRDYGENRVAVHLPAHSHGRRARLFDVFR